MYVCMYVCVGVCGQETQEGPDVHVQEVDGETEKAQVGLRQQAKPCVLCWWMVNGGGSIVVIVIVRHRSTISSVVASC